MSHYEPIRHAYLRNDLRNILVAVQLASSSSLQGAAGEYSRAYAQGFDDALRSVSAALGILQEPLPTIQVRDPHHVWSASGQAQIESETSPWDQERPARRGA
jgi:hypothetical protein